MARTELSEARARVIASERLLAQSGSSDPDWLAARSLDRELTFDLPATGRDNSGE